MNAGGAGGAAGHSSTTTPNQGGGSSEGGHSSKGGAGGKSSDVEQTSTGGTESGTTVVGGGTSSTGGVVGTGGTTATGGAAGSTATGGTTSAQSSVVGTGGQFSGGQLKVNAAPPSPWCVGTEYNAVLTASGGGTNFTWTPGPAVPGLTVGTGTSATIPVTGKPTEAGSYPNVVTVSDGTNTPGALALTVNALPLISNSALAVRCLGEKFEEQLLATGGAATEFEWSAVLPSDLGVTLSPEGVLSGVLKKTGEFNLEFTVKNKTTGCVSTKKTLPLVVNGESSTNCPTIKVKGQPSVIPAPGACEAWPYSAEFEVTGGLANPAWVATNLPVGLTFDSDTRVLSGNPTAGGTITLQVTDSNSRVVQRNFEIPLRKKCWFGYVSEETGASRLHLFDPLLKTRLQRPVSNSTDLTVPDFKFSPDGKFVAYRVKDASNNYKLWLWQAPGWIAEKEMPLGGSVTHYEWSKNSDVLAVAYTATGGTMLGAIDVSNVPDLATTNPIQGHVILTPVSAPVDSELTWFGPTESEYVAFHSEWMGSPFDRMTGSAKLDTNGFTDVISKDELQYTDVISLRAGSDGYFVSDEILGSLIYNKTDFTVPIFHKNEAISPNGKYAARSDAGVIKLYRSFDDSDLPGNVPFATRDECAAVLAWASDPERLVCLGSDNATLATYSLNVIDKSFGRVSFGGVDVAGMVGTRRLMAPSGNWLALSTNNKLTMVSLSGAEPKVRWVNSLEQQGVATNLSFAPSEELVVAQRGASVWLFNVLANGASGMPLGRALISANACQDEWLSASSWCGGNFSQTHLAWSSDSSMFAMVKESGEIVVSDLRVWGSLQTSSNLLVQSGCDTTCANGIRFQP